MRRSQQGPLLVTGGAGFIGSALIRYLLAHTCRRVVNVDALTYAAMPGALETVRDDPRYVFENADIRDGPAMERIFARHRPSAVMHLAAESHVDRSIDGPATFVDTNIVGTLRLLNVALAYWSELDGDSRAAFRFHHVSTDEVYGSLGQHGRFTETTPYRPSSPYAASKASADHLVKAWRTTYGFPTIVSNCSNNYGPFQFPEKLIPLMIAKALAGEPLPVYGDGRNVRDWLYVEDHAEALVMMLEHGEEGTTYNVGGDAEHANIEIVSRICDLIDQRRLREGARPRRELIAFVADRPGHDRRYAVDTTRIRNELGWRPRHDFERGLAATVDWYLANPAWWRSVLEERYEGERLGLAANVAGTAG